MEIQPIEQFVFDGLVKRFSTVFQCRTMITTTVDRTKALEKMFDGKAVEYPYAFLTIGSMARNKESYVNRRMARRGMTVMANNTQIKQARLIPTNFNVEVEYHTNKFSGMEPTTVTGFAKRWLFAADCGYLKFNIQYGLLGIRVGLTMDDSVTTPPLESKVDVEAAYKITANLVVHGYVSEAILGSQGVISDIDVQLALGQVVEEGHVFAPFT